MVPSERACTTNESNPGSWTTALTAIEAYDPVTNRRDSRITEVERLANGTVPTTDGRGSRGDAALNEVSGLRVSTCFPASPTVVQLLSDACTSKTPQHLDSRTSVLPDVRELGIDFRLMAEPTEQGARLYIDDPTQALRLAIGRMAAEHLAADAEERHRLLTELSPDSIMVHKMGLVVYANPAALRTAHIDRLEDAIGRQMIDFVHPDDRADVVTRVLALNNVGDVAKGFEIRVVDVEGNDIPVELTSVRTTWDNEPAYQVILRDLSVTHARRARDEHTRRILEMIATGSSLEQAISEIAVLAETSVAGARIAIVTEPTSMLQRLVIAPSFPEHNTEQFESIARLADALDEQPAWYTCLPDSSPHGVPGFWCAHKVHNNKSERIATLLCTLPESRALDESERVACETAAGLVKLAYERNRTDALLSYQATHDQVTGLPNRWALRNHLDARLAAGSVCPSGLSVLRIGLSGIDDINDDHGADVADAMISGIAKRAELFLHESSTFLARSGEQELTVVFGSNCTSATAEQIARQLVASLADPYRVDGLALDISARGGLLLATTADAQTADLVLSRAGLALAKSADSLTESVNVFDPEMESTARRRRETSQALRRAIQQDGELVAYFQPQVDLQTGGIIGAEALVRWNHPEWGLVPPVNFVPLAEESLLIRDIDSAVLRAACIVAAPMQTPAGPLHISVNVSGRQLTNPDLVGIVQDALEASGLEPDRLCLEVTETALMDADPRLRGTLAQIRSLGVELALDDFGTGYSSLVYLRELPVTKLKLDQRFVRNITTSKADSVVVQNVLSLCKGLRIEAVAEGVEDEETAQHLTEMGCEVGQGYLWGKPIPASEFLELLAAHHSVAGGK